MSSGLRPSGGTTTRVSSGKKRARVAWSASAADESEGSDSAESINQVTSSRPKKRFIWPETVGSMFTSINHTGTGVAKELHRDFIAAVFDMGLKKADPSRIKELMPKKDRSADPETMKSCLQMLRSFRYQMRSALGGDNLDTPEELAQKGIVSPGGALSLGLGYHRNGRIALTRLSSEEETMDMEALRGAFEVPPELASAIKRLDSQQMKKSVELMGQCVQVQRSAHGVLLHAIEVQEALSNAIMDKVRQMGLPMSSGDSGDTQPWGDVASRNSGDSFDAGNGGNPAVFSRPPVSVRVLQRGNSSSVASNTAAPPSSGQAVASAELNAKTGRSSRISPNPLSGMTRGSNTSPGSTRGQLPGKDPGEGGLSAFLSEGGASAGLAGSASSPAPGVSATAGPLPTATAAQEVGVAPPAAPPPSLLVSSPPSASPGATVTPFDHIEWETGNLLSAQQADSDEKSLRRAMKTSMDIHRLLRSRQKDQLQLHRQHQRIHHQSQQLRQGGRNPGVFAVGSASLLPPPPPKQQANQRSRLTDSSATRDQRSEVPATASAPSRIANALHNLYPPQSSTEAGLLPDPSPSVNARRSGGSRSSNTSPPPSSNAGAVAVGSNSFASGGRGEGDAAEAGVNPGHTFNSNAGGGGDVVNGPPAFPVDWNWDEDAWDAQLFNFLLDTDAPE